MVVVNRDCCNDIRNHTTSCVSVDDCERPSRRRALIVVMIHKIGEAWKIPAHLLVRPYGIEPAA
jgi:antitoxin component HigA of HigAB toxin-antitoxin module